MSLHVNVLHVSSHIKYLREGSLGLCICQVDSMSVKYLQIRKPWKINGCNL
jgi:hypothetical protein